LLWRSTRGMTDKKDTPPEVLVSTRGLRALFGNSRPGHPSGSQTEEQIANYYRNAKEGNVAVIRETYARHLWFKVTSVDGLNPKRGRIYLKDAPSSGYGGTAFYIKSGKNCFSPKGQSSLVVPTPEVLAHAEKFPHGKFGESFDLPLP
jgi:hypothetical protein